MKIFENLKNIPENARNAVVVIGNFDGVHRGHQALIQTGRALADKEKRPLAVLTFEPHPRRLFRPDEPPNRITPAAFKTEKLESYGLDILYALPFDWNFASQSADDFVQNILIKGIGAQHIIVGEGFCFGQLRKGSPDTIRDAGIAATVISKIKNDSALILSSSHIREALRHGEITQANAALGWEWEIRGTIIKGDQRGRELGFPTANVPLGDTLHPAYGVYASWARLEGETQWRASATNIGIRPMFEISTAQVETFIFDFDRDIYGQTLHVKPVKRLRSEAKFNALEDLITQMHKDCAQAQEILGVSV